MKPIEAKYIYRLLPHKYPFLLVDRVVKLDPGKSAVGIKNVTINEPYFTGHFPGEPIVPGVLIVESLAQLTAVMYCTGAFPADTNWDDIEHLDIDYEAIADKVGYLVDIRNMKFKRLVRPGDTLARGQTGSARQPDADQGGGLRGQAGRRGRRPFRQ